MRLLAPRSAAALVAGLALLGCGGGASPSGPSAPTPPAATQPPVQLDSGNFDSLVLASPRPSLVEFHSPT